MDCWACWAVGSTSSSDSAWQFVNSNERTRLAADLIKLKSVLEQEASLSPQSHLFTVNSNASESADGLAKLAYHIDASIDSRPVLETPLNRLADAILDFNSGNVDDAIESLKRSLAEDSKQPTAWLMLGYGHLKNGKLDLADQAYATSLALAPNQWRVWFCRGASETRRSQSLQSARKSFLRRQIFSRAPSS